MEKRFEKGQRVIIRAGLRHVVSVNSPHHLTHEVFTIKDVSEDGCWVWLEEAVFAWKADDFTALAPALRVGETTPDGLDQHAHGAKLDKGKVRAGMVLKGFARALWGVAEVGTFGAMKYTEGGWVLVDNGQARYEDAQMRHFLKEGMGEEVDEDSKLEHLKHEAWNALAKLDLYLRKKEKK